MAKDKLFLIAPGFVDPKRDDGPFVCPFCNQVEGLLASSPDLAERIEVERVAFPRPRQDVIAIVGEANQALPLLILGNTPPEDAKTFGDTRFVSETPRILALLAERHGFPKIHGPKA